MKNQDEYARTVDSERLSMRSLSDADEAFYCSLYTNADVMRFVSSPLSRQAAADGFRASLERMSRPKFAGRVLVLLDRNTQEPIGISSIRMLRGKGGRAEVGTLLKPAMHEKGFALECSKALISQAFTRPQIDELIAYSADGNGAVEKLLEVLGFTRGESLPASKGRPARTLWSITRDAWAECNARAASK